MSGIYQLNQATGSVTLPVSGNTFIGTSDNSELYTVDSAGNVTIYGTGSGGGGGSIDTGSFAVTASNSFTGSQTISGSVEITGSLNTINSIGYEVNQEISEDITKILPFPSTGSWYGFRSSSNEGIAFNGITDVPGTYYGALQAHSSGSTTNYVNTFRGSSGNLQTQVSYYQAFPSNNNSYRVDVGDDGSNPQILIRKIDNSGDYVRIITRDIDEGFVVDNDFTNNSASLFKVKDSNGSTLFDARNDGTLAFRPIGTHNTDFTCSNSGTGYGGHYVRVTGNITCSLQPNSSVPVPKGVEWEFFQTDAAQLHFESASGVTLNSKGGALKLTGQFSAATLKKVGTDEWDLIGDLS